VGPNPGSNCGRSLGSVILEEILRRNVMLSELKNVGVAELILTGGWYLWWERRQVVHGEAV